MLTSKILSDLVYFKLLCIFFRYRRTFGVNVLSQFWTLKAFLPEMIKTGTGHIVNNVLTLAVSHNLTLFQVTVSSILGVVGVAQMSR